MPKLPEWGKDDLPEPLPFSTRNAFRVIGPGAILLAGSIGGGEWLVGPAITVQYGAAMMWISTVAIALQVLFNLEAVRYTLYTGEPVITGFMRMKPGSKFWGGVYTVLCAAQLGIPALAAACATSMFATIAGRMPLDTDHGSITWITYAVLIGTFVLLLFGGTIERMLERLSWSMLAYIFTFLVVVNVFFVPFSNWTKTTAGFFSFGYLPQGVDLLLLGALAASSGSGGIGNLAISNWVRDKGFGMGSKVGAIASAVGSKHVTLSPTGKVFPITPENLRRWRVWWRYVIVDQGWLWGLGCFLGMFLSVNLATGIIPQGTDISTIGAGAYQAEYMSRHLWSGFWLLTLLNGFWVMFSTHLGNTEMLVRTITDIGWVANPKIRTLVNNKVQVLYYSLFAGFTVWGMIVVNWGTAMGLFKVLGNIAGFILAFSSIQILILNTRLLPKQLQPRLWRKVALVVCAIFYATFFVAAMQSLL